MLFALTVDQYHQMIQDGILPEGDPFELIYGQVTHKQRHAAGTDPMTTGHEHAWVVTALTELAARFQRHRCHVRVQQPVTLPPYNEPEPDGSLVVGPKERYRDRHPTAEDVLCVIEVADASLRYDRTTKQQIYADSGIACYVIVNLPDRVVDVYTQPEKGRGRYGRAETLGRRQTLRLTVPSGKAVAVPVKLIMP